jgi:arginase
MPIATALGVDNLESQRNNIDNITANSWNKLKSSALRQEDLVYMGVRDTEKEEDYLIQTLNIKNFTVEEIRSLGISKVISDISALLQSCDIIYVSFDVDSMDPDLTSYGTGTPVKGGFSPEEIKGILKGLLLFPKTIALELVEVNPCLDDKNKMAEVALDILEHIVEVLEQK